MAKTGLTCVNWDWFLDGNGQRIGNEIPCLVVVNGGGNGKVGALEYE